MSPVPRTVPECAQGFHTLPFHPPERLRSWQAVKSPWALARMSNLPHGHFYYTSRFISFLLYTGVQSEIVLLLLHGLSSSPGMSAPWRQAPFLACSPQHPGEKWTLIRHIC